LHVYVYSAANFVLYRAFEQIKLHVIENSNRKNNKINITFLNGGSGFCYAGYGIGHYLLDDIHLILT
jgi:transketolase C-terminal domain/subunit